MQVLDDGKDGGKSHSIGAFGMGSGDDDPLCGVARCQMMLLYVIFALVCPR